MPTVSLDGIQVEVPHTSSPDDVARMLEDVAHGLARGKFRTWQVVVSRQSTGVLKLTGGQDGTRFDAELAATASVVVMRLTGSVELGRLKLTLAGGEPGVRRRVAEGIASTLREHVT